MIRIAIEDLHPGMVLAKDAAHITGRVLLRAGSTLTERHITVFKTWGLPDVQIQETVEGHVQANPPACDPTLLQEAEEKVRVLFQHTHTSHHAVGELFRLCIKRYVEQRTNTQDDLQSR